MLSDYYNLFESLNITQNKIITENTEIEKNKTDFIGPWKYNFC